MKLVPSFQSTASNGKEPLLACNLTADGETSRQGNSSTGYGNVIYVQLENRRNIVRTLIMEISDRRKY